MKGVRSRIIVLGIIWAVLFIAAPLGASYDINVGMEVTFPTEGTHRIDGEERNVRWEIQNNNNVVLASHNVGKRMFKNGHFSILIENVKLNASVLTDPKLTLRIYIEDQHGNEYPKPVVMELYSGFKSKIAQLALTANVALSVDWARINNIPSDFITTPNLGVTDVSKVVTLNTRPNTAGQVLLWNGSDWNAVSTSNLKMSGGAGAESLGT